MVFTAQPLAFLIWSTVGHERPLDDTLRSLGEGKRSRHLANANTRPEGQILHLRY